VKSLNAAVPFILIGHSTQIIMGKRRRRLQLDVRNLSLGMRHLVNAYEVEAGTVYFAGNTVWSVGLHERLESEVLQ